MIAIFKKEIFPEKALRIAALMILSALAFTQGTAYAQEPALVITNEPLSPPLKEQVYSKPAKTQEIKPEDLTGASYYQPTNTVVTDKIHAISSNLNKVQGHASSLSSYLSGLQNENEKRAAEYYASIATINTQLQSGTTPGNPRLVKKVAVAESNLENLNNSIAQMNGLAVEIANTASEASFLLETTRAAYSLSGAVEEDHVALAEMEDRINSTLVIINRLLNNISDDITRTSAYISTERNNLRTLSLAVTNGDLYGKSLANHPFSSAALPFESTGMSRNTSENRVQNNKSQSTLSEPRPLVKIRFDRQNVEYEQPVYMAVSEALERYPSARFNLVAVTPTSGNAAETAIESTRARRNAENVLRTLTQMGLEMDRIDLSYKDSAEASTNEVHLYIR